MIVRSCFDRYTTHNVPVACGWQQLAMGKTYSRTFSVELQVDFYPRGTSRDSGHSFAGIFPSPGKHDATVGEYFDVRTTNDISSVGVQPIDATGTCINFRLDSLPTNHFHRSHRRGRKCLARDNQRLLRRLTRLAASCHGLRTVYEGIAVAFSLLAASSFLRISQFTAACAELFDNPMDSAIS